MEKGLNKFLVQKGDHWRGDLKREFTVGTSNSIGQHTSNLERKCFLEDSLINSNFFVHGITRASRYVAKINIKLLCL